MKTSNKILTTFLSIIAIYFLVFALDLRLFGKHKKDSERFGKANLKQHIIPIEDFSHVKLDDIRIEVIQSDSTFMEITYSSDTTNIYYLHDSSFYKFEPKINGDSISFENLPYLHSNNSEIYLMYGCKLFANKTMNSLTATNSDFRLSKFKTARSLSDLRNYARIHILWYDIIYRRRERSNFFYAT